MTNEQANKYLVQERQERQKLQVLAYELQEILDFDVENALVSDCVAFTNLVPNCITVEPLVGEPLIISKREARVLAARLLRAASQ